MNEVQSVNPMSGEVIRKFSLHTDVEVNSILDLAEREFKGWSRRAVAERSNLIKGLAKVLRGQVSELSEMISLEMGKPIEQSKAEVLKCASLCDYYTDCGEEVLSSKIVKKSNPRKIISFQPLGTVLAVMPWNYPFWQVIRLAVPSLMAGNVVMLKHASNVSSCALKIESLFLEAGFDKGVFQTLLLSSSKIADLIENHKIKAVSLTGSEAAGSAVGEAAGRAIKKVVLELGGSDPYLILKDADLDLAAKACVQSRLQNNGQSCIAAKRFIVHESVYEDFKEKVVSLCEAKTYGDPLDRKTDVGPLATVSLADELRDQVRLSIEAGASLGYQKDVNFDSKAFFPITILEDIPAGSPAESEEFFGPVFLLFKFSRIEEAVQMANNSRFGLGGGVFTKDLDLGFRLAEEAIQSGSVFVNDFVKSDPEMPFGGIKRSGVGRELSSFGLHEFVNVKTLVVND